ncbi:MAG: hypothetical protein NXH70_15460 [Hyphomonas sp.]|jgi:hypothetical protein|nr:hypothetical protein [Henriciella sp.]MBO6694758.1 hypothetical protein [Henriciella sp.]MCH9751333.1 hypothetical protein [Alphaproteobacteria bacterium]MCR9225464.1 hypothetical protein [Hyphomonas sp.]
MAKLVTAIMAALFSLALLPAQADSKDPTDVLGSWSFQTKPYRDGQCIMTGTMRLSSHPEDGLYECELTAVEVCSMWGRSVVEQSCKARRFGNQVSVRSQITQMLEQKFEGLIYVPDNFTLTIQDHSRMWGALVSAATAPVEFRRSEDGIS